MLRALFTSETPVKVLVWTCENISRQRIGVRYVIFCWYILTRCLLLGIFRKTQELLLMALLIMMRTTRTYKLIRCFLPNQLYENVGLIERFRQRTETNNPTNNPAIFDISVELAAPQASKSITKDILAT
ncbi:hypothetical protein BD408DRAFT_90649 [Parasitella parasitica]|nr:hypothetical protein BD408DRAFT_90649 [Parasitella parasitica]